MENVNHNLVAHISREIIFTATHIANKDMTSTLRLIPKIAALIGLRATICDSESAQNEVSFNGFIEYLHQSPF
jgi:hypothetical protein